MMGSAGNVVRQADVDSFVVVAVIRDAEEYVCNRCETVLGDEDLGQPIGNSGALRLWPERLSAGCFLPSTVFIFPGKRHASS